MKTIPINTRIIDDEGYKGTVERFNNSIQVTSKYPNGLYYVSHDVNENGYKVNTDGWYTPEKLNPIKDIAQSFVDNIKDNYNKGNLELAYNFWSMLYVLYEPVKNMSEEERYNQFKELLSFTNQIEDKMVYAITDYGREKEYTKMGFYDGTTSNLIQDEELDEPDICDED